MESNRRSCWGCRGLFDEIIMLSDIWIFVKDVLYLPYVVITIKFRNDPKLLQRYIDFIHDIVPIKRLNRFPAKQIISLYKNRIKYLNSKNKPA